MQPDNQPTIAATDPSTLNGSPPSVSDTGKGLAPILQAVTSGQMTTDQLREMLDIQREYEAGEAKKAFFQAMATARSMMGTARRTGVNEHLRTSYSTLDDLVEAATPALTRFGLSLNFKIEQTDDAVTANCQIVHAHGHVEITTVSMPISRPITSNTGKQVTTQPQTVGIAITYAKRYALSAALGIATEDRDGDAHNGTALPTPEVEMIDANDMETLKFAVENAGKDWEKYIAWQSRNIGEQDGVLLMSKAKLPDALKQISRSAQGGAS